MFDATDHAHMARALALAARGRYSTHPNPRVGCVLVRDGRVVGEGWHRVAGGPHAEIHALESAGDLAAGATAYLTLEPCSHQGRTPPCAPALVAAGVARVIAAGGDPDPRVGGAGLRLLEAVGIATAVGLLEAEARALNAGFFRRMESGRPRVVLKTAASLDGRTAMAGGESKWITGKAARADVQRLRAESSAVLTGIGTVASDDPSLDVRHALPTEGRQPLRVVLDPGFRMSPRSRMLRLAGETLVLGAEGDAGDPTALEAAGARVGRVTAGAAGLDLGAVLDRLGALECNDVLVEAGPRLAGAFLAAGLVDELVVYLAPHLMGDAARGMFTLPGLDRLADRVQLRILDLRSVGGDLRIRARPVAGEA